MKVALLLLLCVCRAQADTLTGSMAFPVGSGTIGQPMHSSQLAAMESSLRNSTGNPSATVTAGNWEMSPSGGLKVTYTVLGIDKGSADAVRLGSALMPSKVQSDVNGAITSYYAANPPKAGEPRLGTLETIQASPPASADPADAAKLASISGFITGTMVITVGSGASALQNISARSQVINCLSKALAKSIATDAASTYITTLTGSFSFTFNATGLSLAQEEGCRSGMGNISGFGELFQKNLRRDCSDISWTPGRRRLLSTISFTGAKFVSVDVTATVSTQIYSPSVYEPSDDSINLNNIARVQGTNEFLGGAKMSDMNIDLIIAWIIGIGIIAAPCLICCLCNPTGIACCYCCCICTKAIKKREQLDILVNRYFVTTVVLYVLVFLGFIVGLTGETKVHNGLTSFIEALKLINDVFVSADSLLTNLAAGVALAKTATGSPFKESCPAVASLYTAVSALSLTNPIPTGIQTMLNDMTTQIESIESSRSAGVISFICLAPLVALIPFLYIIKTQLRVKTCDPCYHCCLCVTVPLSFIYWGFLWLLCMLFTIFAVVFADLCVIDPIERINTLIGAPEFGFFLTCKGTVPDVLTTVFKMEKTVTEVQLYLDGLVSLIQKGGAVGCQGVPFSTLKEGLTTIATAATDATALLRCKTINEIMEKILYDGLCYNLVSGMTSYVVSFSFTAAFSLCLLCMYRKYRKTKSAIVPMDDDAAGEEAPLMKDGVAVVPDDNDPNYANNGMNNGMNNGQVMQGEPVMMGQPMQTYDGNTGYGMNGGGMNNGGMVQMTPMTGGYAPVPTPGYTGTSAPPPEFSMPAEVIEEPVKAKETDIAY